MYPHRAPDRTALRPVRRPITVPEELSTRMGSSIAASARNVRHVLLAVTAIESKKQLFERGLSTEQFYYVHLCDGLEQWVDRPLYVAAHGSAVDLNRGHTGDTRQVRDRSSEGQFHG